jgi:hypothetical protein
MSSSAPVADYGFLIAAARAGDAAALVDVFGYYS